jgi:hypothetical protein
MSKTRFFFLSLNIVWFLKLIPLPIKDVSSNICLWLGFPELVGAFLHVWALIFLCQKSLVGIKEFMNE